MSTFLISFSSFHLVLDLKLSVVVIYRPSPPRHKALSLTHHLLPSLAYPSVPSPFLGLPLVRTVRLRCPLGDSIPTFSQGPLTVIVPVTTNSLVPLILPPCLSPDVTLIRPPSLYFIKILVPSQKYFPSHLFFRTTDHSPWVHKSRKLIHSVKFEKNLISLLYSFFLSNYYFLY